MQAFSGTTPARISYLLGIKIARFSQLLWHSRRHTRTQVQIFLKVEYVSLSTPGHKSEFQFTTSTSKVDSHPGNTPKVLGIGAVSMRKTAISWSKYLFFLDHEILLAQNVAFEIPTYDLAWYEVCTRNSLKSHRPPGQGTLICIAKSWTFFV
jgi:hypothetical protein